MANEVGRAARDYHDRTKHSIASIRTALHRLDWSNKPTPFKIYKDLPTFPLPTTSQPPTMATLQAISSAGDGGEPDLAALAQVLFFAAGITKEAQTPDGSTIHFRAAASAGALYPIELYIVCRTLKGLPAGVYHFAPRGFVLTQLRSGDFRSHVVQATGGGESSPPAIVALTALFWRSAWKYMARSYRYCLWDAGTILANLLATARATGLDAPLRAGFVDTHVDLLLGVDGVHEGSLGLVPLGPPEALPSTQREIPPLQPETEPLNREEVEYPQIREIHQASYLETPNDVGEWRGSLPRASATESGNTHALPVRGVRGKGLGATILRRGSTRHFRRTAIDADQLGSILHHSTRGFEADFLDGPSTRLLDLYLISNEVTGIPGGAYYVRAGEEGLELLREGEFRQTAGFLGLEQALPADASAVVFFLADLRRVLGRYGNRGYRLAQIEAGILGGRMYLAAYAQGLGATGLTFYDDEIVDFFSPHAKGKDAIFMVALGKAIKVRSNVRPVQGPFAKESP